MQPITLKLADIAKSMSDGADFIKLRFFMEDMEKRALTRDEAAQKLCDIVVNFEKLCAYVKREL